MHTLKFLWFRHKVVSDSLWPHGLQSARLLCPWDFPGKNTWVGKFFSLLPPAGGLPDSRIKPASSALAGKPSTLINCALIQFASKFHLFLLGPWLIHRGSGGQSCETQGQGRTCHISWGTWMTHWNYKMSNAGGANVRSVRWEWWHQRHPHHWRAFLAY